MVKIENLNDKKLILLKDKGAVPMNCGEVYEQFKGFLHKAIKSFVGKYEFDDLLSVASIGLIKAFKAYDSSKDILFMTYVANVINNELLMYNRKMERHNKTLSFGSVLNIDCDGNELSIEDLISDDKDYAEEAIKDIQLQELQGAISKLPEVQKQTIEGLYFDESTQKQLAEKLSISQSYISRLEKKALSKLNKIYGGNVMREKRITKEQLLEEARILGINDKATKEIAAKYKVSANTIRVYITKFGIRELLLKEIAAEVQNNKPEIVVNEPIEAKTIIEEATITEVVEDEKVVELPREVEKKPVKSRLLQPVLLLGKTMQYKVTNNGFVIGKTDKDQSITLYYSELEDFINELQELKELKNVG